MIKLKQLIGQKAELVSLSASSRCRRVELVECFRNNVLLVALESSAVGLSQIKVGKRFQIRIRNQNVVYCYHVKLIRQCNNEHLCLRICMPGVNLSKVLGRESRIKVDRKEITITLQDGMQKIPVSVKDISVNGARLVSKTRLGKVNDTFNIELSIAGGECSVRLPCRIRYVRTEFGSAIIGEKVKFYHGVEFFHLTDNIENFLFRFVS